MAAVPEGELARVFLACLILRRTFWRSVDSRGVSPARSQGRGMMRRAHQRSECRGIELPSSSRLLPSRTRRRP